MEVKTNTNTIDAVVGEAHDMYEKVRNFYKNIDKSTITEEMCKSLHSELIREHRDFATAYPVVIRLMVYEQFFVESVLRKYFKFISANPWKCKKEYLERQADYLVYVMKYRYPKATQHEIYEYRTNAVKSLLKEDKEFEEVSKQVTQKMNEEMEAGKDARRRALIEALRATTSR
jgi:hypothetical protein